MSERVGVIGMGIMGSPMARNLLKAGFEVHVWNRTAARAEALVADGAQVAASPADLGSKVDVVITMVTSSPEVETVLFGRNGAMEKARPGMLVIDMSTISPDVTKSLAERAAAKGVGYLDAPVSGGEVGAMNGTLSIMIGGEAASVERALPLFQAMGKTIIHVGPTGAGQVVKLANQISVSLNNLGVAEALVFAAAHGADLEKTRQVIAGGAGSSWAMHNYAPKILKGDFAPGFLVDLQQKDLRLVLEAAYESKLSLPGTGLVHELYISQQKAGGGREGNLSLIKVIERLCGVEARQS